MRDTEVVHPGVQHSGNLASALDQADRLLSLTTRLQLGRDPKTPWSWILRSERGRSLFSRRMAENMNDNRITRLDTWSEPLERLAHGRISHSGSQRLSYIASTHFQRRAARQIHSDARVVIGTDCGSSMLFEQIRKHHPEVLRVLDASHPPPFAVQRLLAEDAATLGLDARAYDDYRTPDLRSDAAAMREMELADRVLVASRFSALLYEAAGVPRTKLRVVPYGAPAVPESLTATRRRDCLQVVFVGAVSERKGISILLETMAELERRRVPVRLDIVGKISAEYQFPAFLPANVELHNSVPKAELVRLMSRAHILVLPSMCEGFGRVLLEALSLGTGLVSTTTSPAPDLLSRSPDAPIWILPTETRAERLPDLLEKLAEKALASEIDPERARAAAREWSIDRYIRALDAATSC